MARATLDRVVADGRLAPLRAAKLRGALDKAAAGDWDDVLDRGAWA